MTEMQQFFSNSLKEMDKFARHLHFLIAKMLLLFY